MGVSAVIPTWNESGWLPRLLDILERCDAVDEVVVADNGSSDGTAELARRRGCRVVVGGRPAVGRNRGAKASEGDHLLFLDADVVPTDRALWKVSQAATQGETSTICFRHVPMTDDRFVRMCYRAADRWFAFAGRCGLHHALASFMLVERGLFEESGGFDEEIEPGEDVEMVGRLSRIGPTEYVRDAAVLISPRRFETESAVRFAAKTVLWEVVRASRIRVNPIPYRWERHNAENLRREDLWLRFGLRHGW